MRLDYTNEFETRVMDNDNDIFRIHDDYNCKFTGSLQIIIAIDPGRGCLVALEAGQWHQLVAKGLREQVFPGFAFVLGWRL